MTAISPLPLPMTINVQFNGKEFTLATVTVDVPLKVEEASPGGWVSVAVDSEEMEACLTRALTAFAAEINERGKKR